MSGLFPALAVQGWSVNKSPKFSTTTQKSVSGRQSRVLNQLYPIWTWTLTYEVLRDSFDIRSDSPGPAAGLNELRSLMGFWLAQRGSLGKFLFEDFSDNTTSGESLGTGDSVTTQFQLLRTLGEYGFAEPITAPNDVMAVYLDGDAADPTTYSVNTDTGIILFTSAPGNGVAITADFSYRFWVHFPDDAADFENFTYQLWSLKQLKLESDLR